MKRHRNKRNRLEYTYKFSSMVTYKVTFILISLQFVEVMAKQRVKRRFAILEKLEFAGTQDGLGTISDGEFIQDIADMFFYGGEGNDEGCRDILV